MYDLISQADDGIIIALSGMLLGAIAIVGGITVAVTKVVSAHYRSTQLDEMEATLKMEMVQRGMPADEIAKVLGAKMAANKSTLSEILGSLPQVRMASAFGKRCDKS